MKFSSTKTLQITILLGGLGLRANAEEQRSLGFDLSNPFDVKYIATMEEGNSLGKGEGLAAAEGHPKVEIGLEKAGYVAVWNPDPFQQWVESIPGETLKLDSGEGLVLLDKDDEVIKTIFEKRCDGAMKMSLTKDGVVVFEVNHHSVGSLDANGNPTHLDCPGKANRNRRNLRKTNTKHRSLLGMTNPFDVKYIAAMEEGASFGKGEGLAAAKGHPKVEIGLEKAGYVAVYNPDPFQQWVGRIPAETLKLDSHDGLVLLDKDDKVIKTLFDKRCDGDMKMLLTKDGVVLFEIEGSLVGSLDARGNPKHLDCPRRKGGSRSSRSHT